MIVRRAETSDARALSELTAETYTEAFGRSLSAADLAAELAANASEASFACAIDEDTILIAEMDGHVVGYVQFGAVSLPVERASATDRELRRLYVQPRYQRRAIGSRLMEAALAHPQLKAARSICLDVWERNHSARRFYERYGFVVIGSHRFEVASGAPTDLELIMVRGINAVRPSTSSG